MIGSFVKFKVSSKLNGMVTLDFVAHDVCFYHRGVEPEYPEMSPKFWSYRIAPGVKLEVPINEYVNCYIGCGFGLNLNDLIVENYHNVK